MTDTNDPRYRQLWPGLWALCLANPPGLGAGGLSQQKVAAKPGQISLKIINIYIYVCMYKIETRKKIPRENLQAEAQTCPIGVFTEPIFTRLTTRYLPKEENVVLDGQSVPALYWTHLHPHGTTLLSP